MLVGALAVLGGLCLLATLPFAGGASASDGGTIALHNNTAEPGQDCPPGGVFWHFVFAPNDGSTAFVSITLNLGTETITFSGAQIIPNGGQTDNVFVAVPAGHLLTDLQVAGSSATYSGATPTQFNLSSICQGGGTTTTTAPGTTTTTAPGTTTTASVLGATLVRQSTTSVPGATVLGAQQTRLPVTGTNVTLLGSVGALLIGGGVALMLTGRRLVWALALGEDGGGVAKVDHRLVGPEVLVLNRVRYKTLGIDAVCPPDEHTHGLAELATALAELATRVDRATPADVAGLVRQAAARRLGGGRLDG